MKKITIKTILNKKNKSPITCLSAYSKSISQIADKYCDIILVGDSLGNVLYGMKTTKEVKIEIMMLHCKTVKQFSKRCLVVCDMPYRTYLNKHDAYKNALKLINVTKCDAVKLEGGKNIVSIVRHLTSKGIPVMGHIGLLPQTSNDFKVKGKSSMQKKKILNDAIAISNAGAFSIVLECIVEELAKTITKNITVPTIGIGSSKYCDGQILVIDDLLGLSDFYPRFVKKYANLKKITELAIKSYVKDVKLKKFPSYKNAYR